jgi:hypothetical protein
MLAALYRTVLLRCSETLILNIAIFVSIAFSLLDARQKYRSVIHTMNWCESAKYLPIRTGILFRCVTAGISADHVEYRAARLPMRFCRILNQRKH